MCGIIGVTGVDDALPLLLEGLGRLEYRGYDSAGVVLATEDELWRSRAAEGTHSVSDLHWLGKEAPPRCRSGVGHTRWATHGHPTTQNAHPHFDCSGRLALVHNGIIENHIELAAELTADGHVLVSETDSEVLCHLIESEMDAGPGWPKECGGHCDESEGPLPSLPSTPTSLIWWWRPGGSPPSSWGLVRAPHIWPQTFRLCWDRLGSSSPSRTIS